MGEGLAGSEEWRGADRIPAGGAEKMRIPNFPLMGKRSLSPECGVKTPVVTKTSDRDSARPGPRARRPGWRTAKFSSGPGGRGKCRREAAMDFFYYIK